MIPPTWLASATSPTSPRCLVLAENASLRILVRLILTLEGWDVTEQENDLPDCQALVADLDCFNWPADRVSGAVRDAMRFGLPVLAITGQELAPAERADLGCPLLLKPFELPAFLGVLHSWRNPQSLHADPA
ncbi:MAG: hypothetical protein ACR2M0_14460 [Chloroflexia bacterium]